MEVRTKLQAEADGREAQRVLEATTTREQRSALNALRPALREHAETGLGIQRRIDAGFEAYGRHLRLVKSKCVHGEWETFLLSQGVSPRTAQRHMRSTVLLDEGRGEPGVSMRRLLEANATRVSLLDEPPAPPVEPERAGDTEEREDLDVSSRKTNPSSAGETAAPPVEVLAPVQAGEEDEAKATRVSLLDVTPEPEPMTATDYADAIYWREQMARNAGHGDAIDDAEDSGYQDGYEIGHADGFQQAIDLVRRYGTLEAVLDALMKRGLDPLDE